MSYCYDPCWCPPVCNTQFPITGPVGATGATGLIGATGAAGTVTAPVYAYIYNLAAQTVAIGAPVLYDTNGIVSAGITHTAGSSIITVVTAGTYKVTYIEEGTEPNQFALFQNGVLVPGSIYPSGAGTQPNSGQVIVAALAGSTFTVVNNISAAAVTLATPIAGTGANVNASILFERLGP